MIYLNNKIQYFFIVFYVFQLHHVNATIFFGRVDGDSTDFLYLDSTLDICSQQELDEGTERLECVCISEELK